MPQFTLAEVDSKVLTRFARARTIGLDYKPEVWATKGLTRDEIDPGTIDRILDKAGAIRVADYNKYTEISAEARNRIFELTKNERALISMIGNGAFDSELHLEEKDFS